MRHLDGHFTPKDRNLMLSIPCQNCGQIMRTWLKDQKYCSPRCRKDVAVKPGQFSTLMSTGMRGAVGELTVSADLINKGYEVFRSVSQCASCDLIALRDGVAVRVEVRTAAIYKPTGKLCYSIINPDKADVGALVTINGITYIEPKTRATIAL